MQAQTKKIQKSASFFWEDLNCPTEFFNSPDGKVPMEVYIKKNPVKNKVKYIGKVEKIIHSAPPKFIEIIKIYDYGLIFKNGLEIKGVHKKLWQEIPFEQGMEIIIKNIRPNKPNGSSR